MQNRIDKKFIIKSDLVKNILLSIQNEYMAVEIFNSKYHKYNTTYFDTKEKLTYLNHHNSKGNRFKIRERHYKDTNDIFFEIKFKTNKGRTIKKRTKINENTDKSIQDFVFKNTGFFFNDLIISLKNSFNRITLVSKKLNERITIDSDIELENNIRKVKLDNICIIEVKFDKENKNSIMLNELKKLKINETSFSKYSIGTAILDKTIKSNNFKSKILSLNKLMTK